MLPDVPFDSLPQLDQDRKELEYDQKAKGISVAV